MCAGGWFTASSSLASLHFLAEIKIYITKLLLQCNYAISSPCCIQLFNIFGCSMEKMQSYRDNMCGVAG
jgi:hypothetical protein